VDGLPDELEEQNLHLQDRVEDLEADNNTLRRQLNVAEQEIAALTEANAIMRLKMRKLGVVRRILAIKAREMGRFSKWLNDMADRRAVEAAPQQ
jgi:predicted RNase H-like nuclease (RuvC/YqgF family)